MAFSDVAKTHADYVAVHAVGEAVEWLSHPSQAWTAINAVVTRDPVDEYGNGLRSTIRVLISKTDVASITLQRDRIRLAQTTPGQAQPEYAVIEKLGEGPGSWWLECTA